MGSPWNTGAGPIVSGKLRTGHNVKIGFLSQHAEELSAGTARTAVEATTHLTKLTPNQARGLLGRFMFTGDDVEKPLPDSNHHHVSGWRQPHHPVHRPMADGRDQLQLQ